MCGLSTALAGPTSLFDPAYWAPRKGSSSSASWR